MEAAEAGRAGQSVVVAVARQRAVGVVAAGRAGPVAGPAVEAGVAGGRRGPERGRLRKEPTESKWTAFCESGSYLLLYLRSFCVVRSKVDAVLERKLLEGQVTGFGWMLSRALRIRQAWRVQVSKGFGCRNRCNCLIGRD